MQALGQVQGGSGEGSEGYGESVGGFGAEPGQVQQGSKKGSKKPWWKVKSGSTGFRRRFREGFGAEPGHKVPEKAPEKVWKALRAEPGVQQGSGESSSERLGGFGAEPGEVQQDSGEGSGEGLGGFGAEPGQVQRGCGDGGGCGRFWCSARSGSTGFQRRFQKALVESEVRFNRVPEKVPGRLWCRARSQGSGEGSGEGLKGFGVEPGQVQQGPGESSSERLGGFGAEPGEVQQDSGEGSGEGLGGFGAEPGQVQRVSGDGEGSGRFRCSARSGSTGSGQGSGEGLARSDSTGCRRRFRRRFQEALVQRQINFNGVRRRLQSRSWRRVLGIFGAGPGQDRVSSAWLRSTLQTDSKNKGSEGSGEGLHGRLWCRSRSPSRGFRRRFQRRFWWVLEKVLEKVPEKVWEALVQSQVRLNRVPEKVPEKVWEALVQSREGSGEGVGGFGARLGSREGSREGSSRLWCRAMQVRFNRVLKNVPVKVPGGFGAEPGQVQQDLRPFNSWKAS